MREPGRGTCSIQRKRRLYDPESDVSVFLAAHPECEQIGLSGLYYRTVDGMPEGAIDQIVGA